MYMLFLDYHQLALTVILVVADLEVVTLEALSSYSQQLKHLKMLLIILIFSPFFSPYL
jgi:hypothetical protein